MASRHSGGARPGKDEGHSLSQGFMEARLNGLGLSIRSRL